jgi:hypothetical protein
MQCILGSPFPGVCRMLFPRSAAFLLFASIAFFPSFAPGQIGSGSGSSAFVSVGGMPPGNIGVPYSAQMITTQVQTLTDGTQITHVTKQFQARDSQGRTRNESYLPAR